MGGGRRRRRRKGASIDESSIVEVHLAVQLVKPRDINN
jgi:hypothetical protein